MQNKNSTKHTTSFLEIVTAGAAILILILLLYNPSATLNGVADALK